MSNCLQSHGLCSPWNSPGQSTGVGSHSLLQGIFWTQESEPGTLALPVDSMPPEPSGKPVCLIRTKRPLERGTSTKYKMKLLSCVQLFVIPWTLAYQVPLFMEFSRQEYWSRLPFPSPGDLLNLGIGPRPPALWADTLSSEVPGKPGTSVKEREGNKCEEKFSLVYRSIRMA